MPGFAAAAAGLEPASAVLRGGRNFLHRRYRKIVGSQQLHDSADRLKWLSFFGNNFRGVLGEIGRNGFFRNVARLFLGRCRRRYGSWRAAESGAAETGLSTAASGLAVGLPPNN